MVKRTKLLTIEETRSRWNGMSPRARDRILTELDDVIAIADISGGSHRKVFGRLRPQTQRVLRRYLSGAL